MNIVSLVTRMVDPIRNMWNKRDQFGASLVEYALLLALIAVVALVALHFLGGAVNNTLNNVANDTRHAAATTDAEAWRASLVTIFRAQASSPSLFGRTR